MRCVAFGSLSMVLVAGCDGSEGTLVVATGDGGASPPVLWQPEPDARFQVQLTGSLDTQVDADVFVIDLDNGTRDFDILHGLERRTVCHFSAGSAEPFRADADQLPDALRGNELDDYPDERWLDIRSQVVREVMEVRLERAVSRGCSAVLPENLDVHANDSGFEVTEADALAYARFLVSSAHGRGLAVLLSSDGLVDALVDELEGGLAFACLVPGGCARFRPFLRAGKALWVVEEGDQESAAAVCETARSEGLNVIVKDSEFTDFRVGCSD